MKLPALLRVPTCRGPKAYDAGVSVPGGIPVPVKPLAAELTETLVEPDVLLIVSVSDLLPPDVGLKLTPIVHEAPGASVWPVQRFSAAGAVNWLSLVPPNETLEYLIFPMPVFVYVNVVGVLAMPRYPFPNELVSGLSDAEGATLVPLSETVPMVPTVSVPVRFPTVVGANATDIVQLAFAASVVAQVLLGCVNPVVVEIVPIVIDVVPEFDTVTSWVALVVPSCWLAKVTLVGERPVVAGAVGVTELDEPDAGPVPAEFVAVTVKV